MIKSIAAAILLASAVFTAPAQAGQCDGHYVGQFGVYSTLPCWAKIAFANGAGSVD